MACRASELMVLPVAASTTTRRGSALTCNSQAMWVVWTCVWVGEPTRYLEARRHLQLRFGNGSASHGISATARSKSPCQRGPAKDQGAPRKRWQQQQGEFEPPIAPIPPANDRS